MKYDPFYTCQDYIHEASKIYVNNRLAMEGNAKKGIVYFVKVNRTVKIGFTEERSLNKRLKSLQSGCPYDIQLIHQEKADLCAERSIHKAFNIFSINGEWYNHKNEIFYFLNFVKIYGLINLLRNFSTNQRMEPRLEYCRKPKMSMALKEP